MEHDEENINYDGADDGEDGEPYLQGMFILKVFNAQFLCSSSDLKFYDINWQKVDHVYYNIYIFWVTTLSDEGERTMNMLKGMHVPYTQGSSMLAQYIEVITGRIKGIYEILHSYDGMCEGYHD